MRKVIARGEEANLPPQMIGQLLRPAVSSAQKHHPTAPLLLTALEGLSKRVPTDRLTVALKTFQLQIETAAQLVSREHPAPPSSQESVARLRLIESVAQAHRRGLSWTTVRQLYEALLDAQTSPSRPVLTAAFEVAPALPGSRSSPESVRTLLVATLAEGYSKTDIRKLPDILRPAPSERPPTAALRATIRAVERGRSPAEMGRFAFTTAPLTGPFGPADPSDVPPGLGLPARVPPQRPEHPDPSRDNPGPP